MKKGVKWSIGANSNVNLWSDWWCGVKPLEESVPHSLIPPHVGSDLIKVHSLLDEEGDWDVNTINQSFPTNVAETIFKENPPLYNPYPDQPHWKGSLDGCFSTSSAYNLFMEHDDQRENW